MAKAKKRRQRGTGSLVLRGNVYLARWQDGEGKSHSRTTHETDRARAEDKLKEFCTEGQMRERKRREKAALNQYRDEEERAEEEARDRRERLPALSFADAWGVYLKKRPEGNGTGAQAGKVKHRTSAATLDQYRMQFDGFRRWLEATKPGMTELRKVDRETALEFAGYLEGRVSANTRDKTINALASIWRVLGDNADTDARLKENPWVKSVIPRIYTKPQESTREALSREQVREVLKHADGELKTLIQIGYYTGARLADAATMKWADFDFRAKTLRYVPKKTRRTGAVVAVAFNDELRAILQKLPKKSEYILPEMAEMHAARRWKLSKMIQNAIEAAGIATKGEKSGPGRCPVKHGYHSLRHGFVAQIEANGGSREDAQRLVGHGNPKVTELYEHQSPAEQTRGLIDKISLKATKPDARASELGKAIDALPEAERAKILKILKKNGLA